MTQATESPTCGVCSDPVDEDEAHWLHEEDCQLAALARVEMCSGEGEIREALAGCTCNLVAHPDCCPHCLEEVEP